MLNSLIPRCSVLIYEKDSILRKQHGLLVIARGSTKCVFDDVYKFNFYSSFFSETYLKTADRLVQDAVAAVQAAAAATNNRSEEAKKDASAPLVHRSQASLWNSTYSPQATSAIRIAICKATLPFLVCPF